MINDRAASAFTRQGSATVTNLAREAETALKIDALQNTRLGLLRETYRNESARARAHHE
jgi:hypothetical protein